MKFTSYNKAMEYLYAAAPMFTRIGKAAYKANLDNTLRLDSYFNHPHRTYKTIHIAGTNGKGTVAHTLAAILMDAGYKTGLYTSPHIKDFRERIKINGLNIDETYILDFLNKHHKIIDEIKPSFFEITTLMAFSYFADENVDIAVIETGLGGRLDSTNVITPILSIITNIGWDHSDLLGDSLQKIAGEKAGIIKKHVPVIVGEHQEETDNVFIEKACKEDTELYFADDVYTVQQFFITQNQLLQITISKRSQIVYPGLKFQLQGFYQLKNIPTILTAVDILKEIGLYISDANVYRAFRNVVDLTQFRGRWQILNIKPLIIADIGHNKPALEQNMLQLQALKKEKLFLIIGFMNDKDVHSMLSLLPKDAIYFFTEAPLPRSMNSEQLQQLAENYGLFGQVEPNVRKALEKAKQLAKNNDVIYIGGSTFIVAEVL
ncbi:MAG: bifunctional folylpolyglutamate synthase/dihydrofolate synthase [Bacteroidales bacterium]|nr:bifunctional folylpolyglutamate synthase/dihydrofolate synthase [Bacteroidales bacterium]